MAHSEPDIRPQTLALDALIRDTLTRGSGQGSICTAKAWLFLGAGRRGIPAAVVRDCVLEPVDKLVWMVIQQSGFGTEARTAFPSYRDIARAANVSSTATVSRAMAILRATRWLSLCARNRDPRARAGPTVYALHDAPLPLLDALYLDPGYPAFLAGAGRHHHARVRDVARAICASLDEDIHSLNNLLASVNGNERRHEGVRESPPGGVRRVLNDRAAILSERSSDNAHRRARDPGQHSKAVTQDLQILKAVATYPQNLRAVAKHPQNLKAVVRRRKRLTMADLQNLIFPTRLKTNQRSAAARHLARIPDDQRQAVLDELEGRLQAEQHGAKPIYDELRYLRRLCVAVNRGAFQPNLALKVQAERDRRQRDMERLHEEAVARERERAARASRPKGEHPIAEIRKKLGLPPVPRHRPR